MRRPMAAPMTPPTIAPAAAPVRVLSDWFPITPPTTAPAAAPVAAPVLVRRFGSSALVQARTNEVSTTRITALFMDRPPFHLLLQKYKGCASDAGVKNGTDAGVDGSQ